MFLGEKDELMGIFLSKSKNITAAGIQKSHLEDAVSMMEILYPCNLIAFFYYKEALDCQRDLLQDFKSK